jgi:hypothetical protein
MRPEGHHRVEGGLGAALQQVLLRGLEDVLHPPAADLRHGRQAELEQRRAVGRQDAAVVGHRQAALMQRVDELRATVEVQRVGVAEAGVDQAVFDHARRHAQQHQQMLLGQAGAAGDVQHRGDLAGGVVHRHGRAGQAGELGVEVFVPPHRHRRRGGQAGAHAVGAGLGLAPDHARAQAQRFHLGGKVGCGHHVQDHAVGVGEHHRRFRVRQLLVQRGHLVAGAFQQAGHAAQAVVQRMRLQRAQLPRAVRVEQVLVHATAPGAGHHLAALGLEAAAHHIHHAVGVASLSTISEQHHFRLSISACVRAYCTAPSGSESMNFSRVS